MASVIVGTAQPATAEAWEPPAELPYREVTGPPAGQAPVGAMLVIHGGGWVGGRDKTIAARPDAQRYAEQGWLVWNVDYRSYDDAFGDVRMWYRMLAEETDLPVCASGESAGGHLALLLAAQEDVDCVISAGGPPDLVRQAWLPAELLDASTFDRWENSPQRFAQDDPEAYADTQILIGHEELDPVIPVAPVRDFAAALADRTEIHVMKKGRVPFVHSRVDATQLGAYREAERRLLTRVAAPGSVAVVDGVLSIGTAPGAASDLRIGRSAEKVTVSDPAGVRAGTGCAAVSSTTAECDAAGVRSVAAYTGDRADAVSVDAGLPFGVAAGDEDDRVVAVSGTGTLGGERGNDTLVSGGGSDRLLGGHGRDVADYGARTVPLDLSIDGRPNDGAAGERDDVETDVEWLVAGSGRDRLTGSPDAEGFWSQGGDDTVDGGAGSDWLNGGAGTDTADYSARTTALVLSIDGEANDGHAGEADAIGRDFEFVVGGSGDDRLTGSPANDGLWGQGGDDTIDGRTGGDWLNGGTGSDSADYSARSEPLALSLDDRVNDGVQGERDLIGGDFETLVGGAGVDGLKGSARTDALEGRGGDDTLDGLGGRDRLDGGEGRDVVRSRDLLPDDVVCGGGEDRVLGDLLDIVLGDCELLELL